MNLFATLKSKALSVVCIVLLTALATLYVSTKDDRAELKQVSQSLIEHVELNESLSRQNLEMAEEIRTKPVEFITITKTVEKEICNGKIKETMIKNLPSVRKEGVNEKPTANIDDRLPDDLIKLLQ